MHTEVKNMKFGNWQNWVPILSLPLATYVTLSKLFNLPESQIPHL
jgi:hypothetical protein